MKILVSGANSFIGMKLIERISSVGAEAVAVVRPGCQAIGALANIPNVSICELALEDYNKLGNYCNDVDVSVLLAWNGTRGTQRADEILQKYNYANNLDAIKSLIENGCKSIFTAGSQAEYGPHDGLISEESECIPNTAYGKYKLRLYLEASEQCEKSGIRLVEPRYFSLYGPNDYNNSLIMELIRKMRKGDACDLTECIQNWDYLYIDDAIDALIQLMMRDGKSGVYNFGSGDTRMLRDYVLEMRSLLKSNSVLNFGKIQYPSSGMVSICPDVRKLRSEAAWEPKVSFAAGIQKVEASLSQT